MISYTDSSKEEEVRQSTTIQLLVLQSSCLNVPYAGTGNIGKMVSVLTIISRHWINR